MRDNHLHTYFSYDSKANFEDYLKLTDGDIVTTEHFDLSNPDTLRDDIPDYDSYSAKIKSLNETYGNRFKKGIEIGYYQPREKDIISYLSDKTFDLKLLSVHHNGQFDYLNDVVLKKDKMEVTQDYLNHLEYAIGRVEADVLAHFDYGFRKYHLTVQELQTFENQLKRIFKKMIAQNLAFELNSKSMYLYDNEELYRYALTLLKQLNCQRYSLGSDGHSRMHYQLEFDRILQILSDFNISKEKIIND